MESGGSGCNCPRTVEGMYFVMYFYNTFSHETQNNNPKQNFHTEINIVALEH